MKLTIIRDRQGQFVAAVHSLMPTQPPVKAASGDRAGLLAHAGQSFEHVTVPERFDEIKSDPNTGLTNHSKLIDLESPEPNQPKRLSKEKLKWSDDVINLVELAYGLWLTGQLNNGKASLNEIVRWLESNMQVWIGIVQRRLLKSLAERD